MLKAHTITQIQKLRDEITMVRDFLYDEAAQYVNKVVQVARETKRKPKLKRRPK